MLKKMMSIILTLSIILSVVVLPTSVSAETSGDWEYESYTYESADGVAVTGYSGTDLDVTVPNELESKPVIAIKENAFKDDTQINSITLDDNVKVVEDYAFSGATASGKSL